jgi:hypothetical protein
LSLPVLTRPAAGARHRTGVIEHTERSHRATWRRPALFGVLAAAAMLAVYLGIVSLAESWQHALGLLREDLLLVVPIIAGFGVQMGLFTRLRWHAAQGGGAATGRALAGASGGTSTAAMAACCAHHVADVLPVLGLSGAAIFLAEYRIPFMIVGLLSNLAGILVLWRSIRRIKPRQEHTS